MSAENRFSRIENREDDRRESRDEKLRKNEIDIVTSESVRIVIRTPVLRERVFPEEKEKAHPKMTPA